MRPATLATVLFLTAIALLHLLRLLYRVPVSVGDLTLPVWASVFGVVAPGGLAVWLQRDASR